MARKVLKEVMFEDNWENDLSDACDELDRIADDCEEDEEFETCVKCGKLTNIQKTDDVTFRSGYIEGAGQLCFSCRKESEYGV